MRCEWVSEWELCDFCEWVSKVSAWVDGWEWVGDWSDVARERTAPDGTSRGGIFDGIIACYIYPSLRIATNDLYLLIY